MLPIIQAFAEGKTIEFRNKSFKEWSEIENPSFDPTITNYRIKPESKYCSFANAEECWQEMKKHEPFGWVKSSYGQFFITGLKKESVSCGIVNNWLSYDIMFSNYTFIDDIPFGIKEE